ncbi:MAG: glycosyltransferase family 39 protein [Gemmatimonadetes bacterium]|nr:glycosyltransferase family 39 protein [Gemmatimonadota bacterium]
MRSHDRREALASLTLAFLGGLLSLWMVLDRGWVPFDEGTIGQAAERVLLGQLPHLDFAEPYSGGLAYLHALAMRVFGITLLAPRYALFAAFALWLPSVWWLAKRSCGNTWAAGLPIIATWWSVSIYPAAMPTWYLLFLGTWIVVALERWRSSRRTRWLVLAGVLCGTAVTIKQTGLFLLAGTLLGMLFNEQEDTRQRWTSGDPRGRTDFVILLLLGTMGALVLTLLNGRLQSGELFHLVLPIGGLLALAAYRERQLTDDRVQRWRSLGAMTGVICLAAAVPIVLFVFPYLQHGALDALVEETVGQGIQRISNLSRSMSSVGTLVRASWLVYLVVLLEGISKRHRFLQVLAVLCGVVLLVLSFRSTGGYKRIWFFGTAILPLAVTAVAVAGSRAWRARRPFDPVLLTLASVTALHALNQFPYSAPNYYGYVAPLAFLTAGAVTAHFGALTRARTVLVLLAGFGLLLRVGSVHNVGAFPAWWDYSHRLAVPRGGLLVTGRDSARYTRVLELVARHRLGGAVRAGPELPEMYFLSGTLSPGRDGYSLFSGPVRDSLQLPALFDEASANVIVIKSRPMFVPPLRDDVHGWLARRYPHGEFGDSLEVRWRATR